MITLKISLPKPLKEFVDERVADGTYDDASALVAALVKAERKRRAEEQLLQLVKEADESGPSTPMTSEDWQEIREEVKRRVLAKRGKHGKGRKKAGSRS